MCWIGVGATMNIRRNRTFCVLAFLLVWSTGARAQLSPSAGQCQTDDEAPAAQRAQYEQPALDFVRALLSDPAKAYDFFTSDVKASTAKDRFVAGSKREAQFVSAVSDLHVLHSYRISLPAASTKSGQMQRVLCAAVAHGSTSKPDGSVAAAALPVPLQARVIVEGKAKNAAWDFVVWLVDGQPRWGVLRFDENQATILDKSAQDIWTMARAQQDHKHGFNAFVLFHAALQLADRGPAFQLGIQDAIEKDLASMSPPRELNGNPPFVWTAGNRSFRILNVAPTGVGSTFALVVRQQLTQWGNNDYLERQNRALLDLLKKSYPEYPDVFGAVIIEAVHEGGSEGYRTIDEVRKKPN